MHYYAVITTKRPARDQWLTPLIDGLAHEHVTTCLVNNGDPITDVAPREGMPHPHFVMNIDMPTPNLSRMWNIGLDQAYHLAESRGEEDFIVAVLNDDISLPAGFMRRLGEAIQLGGAAAAFPDQNRVGSGVLTAVGPVPLHMRMCGYAFALRGSLHLRADEDLQWWYGDDDLDWRARQAGGVVRVAGLHVAHHDPNGYTSRRPELHEQAGRDRATFAQKWGMTPW